MTPTWVSYGKFFRRVSVNIAEPWQAAEEVRSVDTVCHAFLCLWQRGLLPFPAPDAEVQP